MPKLLEINPLRKNLYAPGSHIPVVMEDEEKELPNIYYVLALNFKDEILRKNKKLLEDEEEFTQTQREARMSAAHVVASELNGHVASKFLS